MLFETPVSILALSSRKKKLRNKNLLKFSKQIVNANNKMDVQKVIQNFYDFEFKTIENINKYKKCEFKNPR